MWKAAGYWTNVRARYGELTDIDIDKLAKYHGASAALDAFCKQCQIRGMSPDECAQAIVEDGFSTSSVKSDPKLGQIVRQGMPLDKSSRPVYEAVFITDTFEVESRNSQAKKRK